MCIRFMIQLIWFIHNYKSSSFHFVSILPVHWSINNLRHCACNTSNGITNSICVNRLNNEIWLNATTAEAAAATRTISTHLTSSVWTQISILCGHSPCSILHHQVPLTVSGMRMWHLIGFHCCWAAPPPHNHPQK